MHTTRRSRALGTHKVLALLQEASAGVRGEFENHLQGVIAEAKASLIPIILIY